MLGLLEVDAITAHTLLTNAWDHSAVTFSHQLTVRQPCTAKQLQKCLMLLPGFSSWYLRSCAIGGNHIRFSTLM